MNLGAIVIIQRLHSFSLTKLKSAEQKTYAINNNAYDFFVVRSEHTSSNPFKQLTCFDLFRPFGQICQAEILRQLFACTHEKQNCNSIKRSLFFLFHFFSLFLSFACAPFQKYCCLESE